MDAGLLFVKRKFRWAGRHVFGVYREAGNVLGNPRKIGNASKNIP